MYLFGLASRLHRTVDELTERLTAEEFAHWVAYDELMEKAETKQQAQAICNANVQNTIARIKK